MIVVEGVSKTYADGQPAALDNVSLQIADGSIFGIVGRSGAGKSTLLRCLNLLERPTSGRILMDGQDLTRLTGKALRQQRQRIGMIFQGFNLLHSRNVADNVAVPLEIAGVPKAERVARVAQLLALVGLSDKAAAFPSQLSGGQKQRVGIARALAARPAYLLSDEATSALDPETTASILALLRDINRQLGWTIVLITHDAGRGQGDLRQRSFPGGGARGGKRHAAATAGRPVLAPGPCAGAQPAGGEGGMKTDWNEVLQLLLNATGETLYMVLLAGLFTLLIGLPLGVLLFISARVGCSRCQGSTVRWVR